MKHLVARNSIAITEVFELRRFCTSKDYLFSNFTSNTLILASIFIFFNTIITYHYLGIIYMILVFGVLRAFTHTESFDIRADIIFFSEIHSDYISPVNLTSNIIVTFCKTIDRNAYPLTFIGNIITAIRARRN